MESFETALTLSGGLVYVADMDDAKAHPLISANFALSGMWLFAEI